MDPSDLKSDLSLLYGSLKTAWEGDSLCGCILIAQELFVRIPLPSAGCCNPSLNLQEVQKRQHRSFSRLSAETQAPLSTERNPESDTD